MPPGQFPLRPPRSRGRSNVLALVVVWGLVGWVIFVGAVYLLTADDGDDEAPSQAQADDQQEQPDQPASSAPGAVTPDPGSGGADRQAYVDAMVAADEPYIRENEMFTRSDSECVVGAAIDAWGLPAVQAAGTPEQLAAVPFGGHREALGLVMDRTWGNEMWDNMSNCMDVRQVLDAGMPNDPTLSPDEQAGISCMFDNLTDDELRDFFVSILIDEALPDATSSAAERAALDCLVSPDVLPALHADRPGGGIRLL